MLNNLYINGEIIKHCNNIEKYKQFAKKLLFINTDTKLYKSVINIDNNLYIRKNLRLNFLTFIFLIFV